MTEERLAKIRRNEADQLARWNPVLAIADRRELLAEVDRLRAILAALDPKEGASKACRVSRLGRVLGALPPRLRWVPHTKIGHPLSEALLVLGFRSLAVRAHYSTIPCPKE
jgi:hypothetical protein